MNYLIWFKDIFKELRQYGFRSMFWKIQFLREAWWEKRNKVKVGEDKYGNTYWMTTKPTDFGRDRWVEIPERDDYMFDPSRVPAEWHSWLHHMRDEPPTPEEIEKKGRRVKVNHNKNWTGSMEKRYFPPGEMLNPCHRDPRQKKIFRYDFFIPDEKKEENSNEHIVNHVKQQIKEEEKL